MLTLRNPKDSNDQEQPVNHDILLILLIFMALILAFVGLINVSSM